MGKLSFVSDIFGEEEASIVVLGIPLGKGSKKVLRKIREASRLVEPFDINTKRNLLKNVRIWDKGDLKLKSFYQITTHVKKIIEKNKIPLLLGGGHLLSYYSFKAYDRNTKLLVFDAHAELKENYMDKIIKEADYVKGKKISKSLNDATWLRRVCKWHNPKKIMLVGIRSLDEDEFDFIKKNGIIYLTSAEIKEKESYGVVRKFTKLSNVYVSLDVDVFDPSVVANTYYPEPNGIFFSHFKKLVEAIAGNIVGIDLCCIKPDTNNLTEVLAVRAVFELLGKF